MTRAAPLRGVTIVGKRGTNERNHRKVRLSDDAY